MESYGNISEKKLNLPSPPVVIGRLQECLNNKDVSYHEVANIIETDQAFTAKILRLVNSPFYGFAGKVTSIEEAITMLGLNTVHQLLLTTLLLNTIKYSSKVIDLNQFWLHSFGVGVIAKHLLVGQNKELMNEVFLGGILHDIGRMILLKMDPLKFERLYSSRDAVIDLEMEKNAFGIDHQKLGEFLSQKWNFPESITTSIAFHHSPEDAPNYKVHVSAVNIADIICHALEIGDSGTYFVTKFYKGAWDTLGLSTDKMYESLKNALKEVEISKSMLHLISK